VFDLREAGGGNIKIVVIFFGRNDRAGLLHLAEADLQPFTDCFEILSGYQFHVMSRGRRRSGLGFFGAAETAAVENLRIEERSCRYAGEAGKALIESIGVGRKDAQAGESEIRMIED